MTALRAIRDYAAAADGGSLAFHGEDENGAICWYMVNRSISARGTPEFNTITRNGIRLNDDERSGLFRDMATLKKDANTGLATFIDHFMT